MFPSAVDYRTPETLDEALELLRQHGDDAKVLAGGQSLVPLLKLRFASPALLVDIGRIPGLDGITREDGALRVGARTTHAAVERTQGMRRTFPLLAETAPLVSDPLIRNMGTVGGSLCHADPAGDWGSVMLATGAEVTLRSASGERTVRAADLFEGPFTTTVRPDEMMTSIRLPLARGPASGTYLKLERKVGDFATVGVAVQLELDDGHIARAGIGLTGVGPTNLEATAAEQSLAGREPTDEAFTEAARLASEAARPNDDIRGSAAYKRDVVRVFVRRGLRTALERAREGRA